MEARTAADAPARICGDAGPAYTAQALHWITEGMRARHAGGQYETPGLGQKAAVDAEIAAELHVNRYDADSGRLALTAGETDGWKIVLERTAAQFGPAREQDAVAGP